MAQLNFPPVDNADGNPTDGMIWTAPNGKQWIYKADIPGWRALAPTGNSNIVYRGGIDLTQDPNIQFNDIAAGNQFAVSVGSSPVDDALYPGLGGEDIAAGQIVMYDGNQWQYFNNVPYATETVAGVVELATQQEAIDGTNHTKAMTPLRVQQAIPQATTTVAGKTRYATQVEAEAGIISDAALTPSSIYNLLQNLDDAISRIVPTGMVMWWTAKNNSDLPIGWIKCDGSIISNSGATAGLYNHLRAVGNPWGPGSGSTTVRVPDLRGRFVRGYHEGLSIRDPDTTVFGGSQADAFKYHSHTASVTDPGHDHNIGGNRYKSNQSGSNDRVIIDDDFDPNGPKNESTSSEKTNIRVNVQPNGYSETRPKNLSLVPVIKL